MITAPYGINVYKAAYTMAPKHMRELPIANAGELRGTITARDLVEALRVVVLESPLHLIRAEWFWEV